MQRRERAVGEYSAGERLAVHMMEPNNVDAVAGEAVGDFISLIVGGKGRAKTEIDAEEANASLRRCGEEVAILGDDCPVRPAGRSISLSAENTPGTSGA